jgi:hypothetical protein
VSEWLPRLHRHSRNKPVEGAMASDAFRYAQWVAEEPEQVAAIPGAAARLVFSHATDVLADARRERKTAIRVTVASVPTGTLISLVVLLRADPRELAPALDAVAALTASWGALGGSMWTHASKREKHAMGALQNMAG